MKELEDKLKILALKTMFELSDEEMPAMIEEYEIFMNHVEALETIDTNGVEPLSFPYEYSTTFLREDEVNYIVSTDEILKNAPDQIENQIRLPRVVKE
jgi:aspartyl/glutamyl-tRNA(Asn/Gln) amidotransferase, C subunit